MVDEGRQRQGQQWTAKMTIADKRLAKATMTMADKRMTTMDGDEQR